MAMLHDDVHFCKHCNKNVPHVHFCTSVEEAKKFTCEYCGAENINHRHMCKHKLEHIQFYCVNCGAVAVSEMEICNPVPIKEAQRKEWQQVAEKSETETLTACRVCGQPVSAPGHVCDQKYPYVCKFCGEEITKGHHHCKGKLGKAKYDCKTCGRIAVEACEVCAPFKFRDADE